MDANILAFVGLLALRPPTPPDPPEDHTGGDPDDDPSWGLRPANGGCSLPAPRLVDEDEVDGEAPPPDPPADPPSGDDGDDEMCGCLPMGMVEDDPPPRGDAR